MDAARWERLQAVFLRVVDLPDGERTSALEEVCGDDAELKAEVIRLCEEDAREASPLDADLGVLAGEVFAEGPAAAGRTGWFGPYRTIRQLGEGGMGVVYLAERSDLGQKAAVKVLRDAWVSPGRRERFTNEQRALARLGHPSIARLYDADTLEDGTPFFVMEYVEGLTLMEYCRERAAALDERLRLFRDICEAVQHAHQQLIIHRDLKPSNILVTSGGEVKLLDFGIAKELERHDSAVDQTQTVRLLTPRYASPEQVRGEPVGIYTDVYALGVLLYELLTDRPPFDLTARAPHDAESYVLTHEPPAPSAVAAPPAPLQSAGRTARADLDVVCLRAMHKDPRRRYPSVEALIRDLDHFARGEPLEARPDSWRYRTGKFVRRHAGALAAAAATVSLTLGLVGFYTARVTSARNAALAEAARTRRVERFVLKLFEAGETDYAPATDLKVVTLVDRGVREAQGLDRDPAIQAELFHTLGTVYQRLGNFERADTLLQASLDTRRRLFGQDHADVADSLVSLGLLRVSQARLADAEPLVREGLDRSRAGLPRGHPVIAGATVALGKVYYEQGKYDRAIPILEEAVRLYSASPAAGPTPELSGAMTQLANAHYYAGHLDEADAINTRVLEIDRRLYGPRHPSVADDLINLGATRFERGSYAEAERYRREALGVLQAWFGDDHPETASAMTLLSQALIARGTYDEAATLLQRALATHERTYGPVHPRVAIALSALGSVALKRNDYDAAERDFARALAIQRAVYRDGPHVRVGISLANLASVHFARGDFARAEATFREAISTLTQAVGASHTDTSIARLKLGRTLVRERRFAEAEGPLLAAYDAMKPTMSPGASWLQSAREELATVYDALGRPERARTFRDEHAANARGVAGG